MNVEIGAEAALFPEKEYISGIFVAVYVHPKVLYWLFHQTGVPYNKKYKYNVTYICLWFSLRYSTQMYILRKNTTK